MPNNNGFTILLILFVVLSAMVAAIIAIALYYEADKINKVLTDKINHAPDPVIIEVCPGVATTAPEIATSTDEI